MNLKKKFPLYADVFPSINNSTYFTDLFNYVDQLKFKKITLVLASGNAGDGLINSGAIRFFNKTVKRYNIINPYKLTDCGELALLLGAGGFCHHCNHAVERVKKLASLYEAVIVLPSSFELSDPKVRDLIITSQENITYFARENYSFESLKAEAPFKQNILLSCDMAFYNSFKISRKIPPIFSCGCFLRKDRESVIRSEKRSFLRNIDVSSYGNDRFHLPILFGPALCKEVITDRLHVGLAAIALNRKVTWINNSNGKVLHTYLTYFENYRDVCTKTAEQVEKTYTGNSRLLIILFKILIKISLIIQNPKRALEIEVKRVSNLLRLKSNS